MTAPNVVIVSNDIVPGMGMPVAAPGLRAWGLALGLGAHGWDPTLVVMGGPVSTQWQGTAPPPTPAGAVVVSEADLEAFVGERAPVTVVLTNTNQARRLVHRDDVRVIVDLFSPQVLERVSRDTVDRAAVRRLRDRKLAGLRLADGFVVNGAKKVPYFLGWMTRAGIDVRSKPIEVVEMALPIQRHDRDPASPLRVLVAGYLQRWSSPGAWIRPMARLLDEGSVELHLVTPVHWGQPDAADLGSAYDDLLGRPGVVRHEAMRFGDFRRLLAHVDVALDLFPWSLEREFAMVTRSVVALASGVPVVHPPFTEVAPLVDEYGAGWLVDPSDETAVARLLAGLAGDPSEVVRRSRGAERLGRERLDVGVAVEPLARMLAA